MAVAALVTAPAACRDSEPQAERPEPPPSVAERPVPRPADPVCDLLTDDDLRSAVGAPVSSTTPADQGVRGLPGATCIYIFEGPSNQAVLVSRSDSPEAERVLDQVRTAESARPVPGIEDAVVVNQEAYLRKGSVLVSITLSLDQDFARTAETASRLVEAVARRV